MKNIIGLAIFLALYAGSLVYKNAKIEEKKGQYIPTTYDLQKKNGIPVTVEEVQRNKFQEFITITGKANGTEMKSSVAPLVMRQIRIGTPVKLTMEGKKPLWGKVSSISGPALLTGLYDVNVEFNHALPKSTSLTVDIPVKEVNNVLLIPREALNIREPKPVVFVVKDNKLEKKYVEIAGANAEVYWVKSGLAQNEIVVTSDTRYFSGGELVKVVNQTRNNL